MARQAGGKLKVVICGGGNAGHAFAALLSARDDVELVMLTLETEVAALTGHPIVARTPNGPVSGTPARISSNAAEVVPGADVVILSLPGFAHGPVLDMCKPFLKHGVLVGAIPTQSGFEWVAKKSLGGLLYNGGVTLFGMHTLPFACRIKQWGSEVEVCGFKEGVFGAALPAHRMAAIHDVLSDLIAPVKLLPSRSFLNITMVPANQIVHPGLMYAYFHDEPSGTVHASKPLFYAGLTPAAAAVLADLSREALAIRDAVQERYPALDLSFVWDLKDMIVHHYKDSIADPSTLQSAFNTCAVYKGITTPMVAAPGGGGWVADMNSRYLTEDVPCGLVAMCALAGMVDVPTPTMLRVLAWCEGVMGKEYLVQGHLTGRDIPQTRHPFNFGLRTLESVVACELGDISIAHIDVRHVRLPLAKPYKVAFGTITHTDLVVACIRTAGMDITGWGEADPLPHFTEETYDSIMASLKRITPLLVGFDATNIARIMDFVREHAPGQLMVQGCIEMALMDIQGKQTGLPVSTLLGGRRNMAIPILWPFGCQTPDEDVAAVRAKMQEGFKTFMLKIGGEGTSVAGDVARVQALRDAFGSDIHINVDANQGYSLDNAMEFAALLHARGLAVDFFEQPLPRSAPLADWVRLRDHIAGLEGAGPFRLPVSIDESAQSAGEVASLLASGVAQVVSAKVSKNGGLHNGRLVADVAHANSARVLCNSMLESGLAQAALLQLACTIPNLHAGGHCFMSTLRLADDITNFQETCIRGGTAIPPMGLPGLGVEVAMDKLDKYTVEKFSTNI